MFFFLQWIIEQAYQFNSRWFLAPICHQYHLYGFIIPCWPLDEYQPQFKQIFLVQLLAIAFDDLIQNIVYVTEMQTRTFNW